MPSYTPNTLTASYHSGTISPSSLSQPYDLTATYDAAMGDDTLVANAIGFGSLVFGEFKVELSTNYIIPNGIVGFDAGTTSVWNWQSHVKPSGFNALTIGHPVIRNINQEVRPVSVPSGLAIGTAWASLKQRGVVLTGWHAQEFAYNYPTVKNRNRHVQPAGISHNWFGSVGVIDTTWHVYPPSLPYYQGVSNPAVRTQYRFILGAGWLSYAGNNPGFVAYRDRALAIAGFTSQRYGTLDIRDRRFYPKPTGVDTLLVGVLRVDNERRTYALPGVASYHGGTASVRLGRRYVAPMWIYSYKSGYPWASEGVRIVSEAHASNHESVVAARIWIHDRTLVCRVQGFDSASVNEYGLIHDPVRVVAAKQLLVGAPPKPTVFNRIQYVHPTTAHYDWVGTAYIKTATQIIPVATIQSLRFGGGVQIYFYIGDIHQASVGAQFRMDTSLVAFARRYVQPLGVDSAQISMQAHLRNLGIGVRGVGFYGSQYGRPNVENAVRTYKIPPIQIAERSGSFSGCHVSFGVRSIAVFSVPHSSYASVTAWVSLGMRHIQPAAIQTPTILRDETEVFTRFTYIKPIVVQTEGVFGTAAFVFFDREVKPSMWPVKEESLPSVVNRNRSLFVTLEEQQRFGAMRISDRRLLVDLFGKGLMPVSISKFHKIQNLEVDPPSLQKIFATGWWAFSDAVTPQSWQVPAIKVGTQTVYAVGVGESLAIGALNIYTNGIIVDSGIWTVNMGAPAVSPFYIHSKSIGVPPGLSAVGKAFVNPYYIYAPYGEEAPELYNEYQDTSKIRHVIDGRMYTNIGSSSPNATKVGDAWVPRPRVAHWVQTAASHGFDSLWMTGIGTYVYNAEVPVYAQYVKLKGWLSLRVGWVRIPPDYLYAEGWVESSVTRATVRHKPTNRLVVSGLAPAGFGLTTVDFYHRFIKPSGWDSRAVGVSWASFRVRGLTVGGIPAKTVVPSALRIDYKVRTILPLGETHLNPPSAYRNNPTTVRNRYDGLVVTTKGLSTTKLGDVYIADRTQHLAPRALYAVPLARPTLKASTTVYALGTEHLLFGHVRKFEDGVVYPHEFGEAVFDMPRVTGTKQVQGFDSAVVDYPVIAKHIGAYGTEKEKFGAAVLENEFCCGGC